MAFIIVLLVGYLPKNRQHTSDSQLVFNKAIVLFYKLECASFDNNGNSNINSFNSNRLLAIHFIT